MSDRNGLEPHKHELAAIFCPQVSTIKSQLWFSYFSKFLLCFLAFKLSLLMRCLTFSYLSLFNKVSYLAFVLSNIFTVKNNPSNIFITKYCNTFNNILILLKY